MKKFRWIPFAVCSLSVACTDSADPGGAGGATSASASSTGSGETAAEAAPELDVTVPESGRVYVNLGSLSVVTPSGDPLASNDWDLAFEGFDVFTNSGPSGGGQGEAFGPLDLLDFLGSDAPTVPFMSPDKAGGAFLDWYAYDGSVHALYSRFHTYGVKTSTSLFKVQVLAYYSEQDNAPVSALYQVRYADLGGDGQSKTISVDGTAGGLSAPASAPSGCVSLSSGEVTPLTEAAALASTEWDLCFRRDSISVNGEKGGPGSVGAVDLQAGANEALADVKKKTAATEQAAFDAVTQSSFGGATLRGDHVVSAFEVGKWIDTTVSPVAPAQSAWLVSDQRGKHMFLVAFTSFQNVTAASPGTVVMHIKPVSG